MRSKHKETLMFLLELVILFAIISAIVMLVLLHIVLQEASSYVVVASQPQIVEVPVEVEKIVEVEVEVPVEVNSITSEEPNYIIDVTNEEIELMKRVVMSESSICDFDVKCAVAATIVNRVLSGDFPDTVTQVVYMPNAYSTQNNGDPDDDCERAVMYALKYQVFPKNMFYFRTGNYHSFGEPLMKMGNMFFSTN